MPIGIYIRTNYGEKHHNWKGGKPTSSSGYILIKVPKGHHLRMNNGYAYEHQLVAEEILGRRLLPNEIVHHINGIKTDNRKENIQICSSRFEHKVNHRISGKNRILPEQKNILIKCACGCNKFLKQFDSYGRERKYLGGHGRKGRLSYNPDEIIICGCGCGIKFKKYDISGRVRHFIRGHGIIVSNQYGVWKRREYGIIKK